MTRHLFKASCFSGGSGYGLLPLGAGGGQADDSPPQRVQCGQALRPTAGCEILLCAALQVPQDLGRNLHDERMASHKLYAGD